MPYKDAEARKRNRQQHYVVNRDRIRKQCAAYYEAHAEEIRDSHLTYYFGVTRERYDEMLKEQNGGCDICGKTPEENGKRLAVDHDHVTGKVRRLLCKTCNSLLGFAFESVDILQRAIDYLRRNQ